MYLWLIYLSGVSLAKWLKHISHAAHCCCKFAASVLQRIAASLPQVYFSYAIFFSGTLFLAHFWHTLAAYFWHTVYCKCKATILFVCNFFSLAHSLLQPYGTLLLHTSVCVITLKNRKVWCAWIRTSCSNLYPSVWGSLLLYLGRLVVPSRTHCIRVLFTTNIKLRQHVTVKLFECGGKPDTTINLDVNLFHIYIVYILE
jgi:hypothetical protein